MSLKDVGYGRVIAMALVLLLGVGDRCSVVGDGGSLGGVVFVCVGSGAGTSVRVSVGGQRWWSMESNVLMAADSLSVRVARGYWADGFARAWIMSLAAALMMSVEEASSMVTLVENQLIVSQIRWRWVSHIHTS